jgi:CBS domain-containing protein
MLSQPIGTLEETGNVVSAPPRTSVAEAAASMLAHRVSAVVVVEAGLLVGIFTEHDIVSRVIATGREAATVLLGDVMTPNPLTLGPEATLGRALVLMRELGVRHLPVVVDRRPIGMVCARDALDPELEDFISEEVRRKSYR